MEWNNPLQNDEEYQAALDRLWEVFFAEPGRRRATNTPCLPT